VTAATLRMHAPEFRPKVDVEALGVKDTYNIYGAVNIKGTFAKCPLAAT
jgi:hypothetical protein